MDAADADVRVLRLGAVGVDEIVAGVEFFADSALGVANGVAAGDGLSCCCEDCGRDADFGRRIGEGSGFEVFILMEMIENFIISFKYE